jgi:PIN domain nuclease of toxin-antitoxin system
MRLLLDTHIWLWSLLDPGKLSRRVSATIGDADNELWLSSVSVWEFLTLVRKGRLTIAGDLDQWLREALQRIPLREAPVTHDVAIESQRVELPHWDPADRFIAATSRLLGARLVTADERLIEAKGLSVLANR